MKGNMEPNRQWMERIKDIFARARNIPADEERDQFVAQACGDNADLRKEVESLLEAYGSTTDFLSRDASGAALTDSADLVGTVIDEYHLVERIGEGGFGEVFRAEQTRPLRREVALKIIKLGMDTRNVIARFEAERQALARMSHPGIAQVYDAGITETGRPYFVMELVRGIPFLEYCDRERLPLAERLDLFRQVCDAVQHAHQKGILHRDLKPSNILVSEENGTPMPKIIDFGVAKSLEGRLTEQTLATLQEMLIGTPLYMSPEQLDRGIADVDTRTDIYSLGIILYELVAGTTPLEGELPSPLTIAEMRNAIAEKEIPRPSRRLHALGHETTTIAHVRQIKPLTLQRLLRGDLDWVVMKAIEKERDRRYDDIGALAKDLQHYINHEPVSAGPPGVAYRAKKFIRRQRMATAVAASLVLSLLLGAVGSGIGFVEARSERNRALAAESQAERSRKQAEIEAVRSTQVARFLKSMLQGVGPSVAMGRDTTMLGDILDATSERLAAELQDQPEVVADLKRTLGWVYFDLGKYVVAEAMHRDALKLSSGLYGYEHPDVAESLHGVGHALWAQGKLDEAESMQREALSLWRTLFNLDNLDTARSLNDLALVLYCNGSLAEAAPLCRQALSIRRDLLDEPHADIAHSMTLLGAVLRDLNRLAEAEQLHRDTLEIRRVLYGKMHPYTAFSLGALGAMLVRQGKLTEAESLLYKARAIQDEVLPPGHIDAMQSRYVLAVLLVRRGKVAEAAEVFGMDAAEEPAVVLDRIAWGLATCIYAPLRDGAQAVDFAEQAVAATQRSNAGFLNTLAAAYAESGRLSLAVQVQQEAVGLASTKSQRDAFTSRLRLYMEGMPYHHGVPMGNGANQPTSR
jgi:serine/threonine protein kinase